MTELERRRRAERKLDRFERSCEGKGVRTTARRLDAALRRAGWGDGVVVRVDMPGEQLAACIFATSFFEAAAGADEVLEVIRQIAYDPAPEFPEGSSWKLEEVPLYFLVLGALMHLRDGAGLP